MKYIIALLLIVSSVVAQNNTGTLVIAPIRPQATSDTFPSAIANEIKGGPFSVATTAAMSNIPSERLVAGSLAYVTNDNSFRIYNGTNWIQSGVRDAIGLGATWLTNTNINNFRDDIGLGTNGAVAFSGFYNNGNSTNINGTIYGLKTNVGPFEGIGNFFASNNTTVSNETLFRVGLAEATNKSAQFGFRVTRTNNGGEGVAVYSVFGYNALMMIGPSDRSRINYATNTNAGIEATLWTVTPTNQVMTLRDTNTGATTLHQSLGFDTNVTSTAPTNTTNIVKWIEVWVGTNSYRMPLYQ